MTSSGLHGANRLASNSLLEALVYGAHAGEGASRAAAEMSDNFSALPHGQPARRVRRRAAGPDRHPQRAEEPDVAERGRSPRRRGAGRGPENVDHWCSYVLARQFADPAGWELQNMLCVARLMIAAALARTESRGAHVRTDFPATDDAHWDRHI